MTDGADHTTTVVAYTDEVKTISGASEMAISAYLFVLGIQRLIVWA